MMGIGLRTFLDRLGKRKGNASRSKGRIGSKDGKRAAAKAVRSYKSNQHRSK